MPASVSKPSRLSAAAIVCNDAPWFASSRMPHTLRAQLQAQQGYAVVEGAPGDLRQQLDVWGHLAHAPLLSLYKQSFDPHAVLNPGRYVAGL